MARLLPMPDGAAERLRLELKKARTKEQYQRVLCVWLRAALGMPSRQVAMILGWSPVGVRQLQARYLRQGEGALKSPGRGGRRRQHLTEGEERGFLAGLLKETHPNATLDAGFIQKAYEERLGKPVTDTVVYRLLKRHGWRRLAQGRMLARGGRPTNRCNPNRARMGLKPGLGPNCSRLKATLSQVGLGLRNRLNAVPSRFSGDL